MSVHREKLDKICTCGAPMQRVSMKNPFLDDAADECLGDPNKCNNAHVALPFLTAAARGAARMEEALQRGERGGVAPHE